MTFRRWNHWNGSGGLGNARGMRNTLNGARAKEGVYEVIVAIEEVRYFGAANHG